MSLRWLNFWCATRALIHLDSLANREIAAGRRPSCDKLVRLRHCGRRRLSVHWWWTTRTAVVLITAITWRRRASRSGSHSARWPVPTTATTVPAWWWWTSTETTSWTVAASRRAKATSSRATSRRRSVSASTAAVVRRSAAATTRTVRAHAALRTLMSQARRRELTCHSASHASSHHRSDRIAVFVSAWSSLWVHSLATVAARTAVHWHRRCFILHVWPTRTATSARGPDAGIADRVQRCPIIRTSATSFILAVGLLALHLKRSELWRSLGVHRSTTAHRWRTVGSRKLVGHQALLVQVLVVVRAVHIRILRNTLLARLPAHQRPAHRTSDHAGCHNQDGSRKYDPATPLHVRDEQKDVDQECEKRDQQGRDSQDEESQKVAW